jgi:hypothetical protein
MATADDPNMRPANQNEPSSRRRVAVIGLTLLVVVGGVLAAGMPSGFRMQNRPVDAGRFRPEDLTDEEWDDDTAYQSSPEKREIESLGGESAKRFSRKQFPLFESGQLDRVLELTRHPNFSVRLHATYLLSHYQSFQKIKAFDSDPVTQSQCETVHRRVVELVEDPSSYLRGWALHYLGWIEDERFVSQASRSLHSDSKTERAGAEFYLIRLAGRQRPGK